MTKSAFVLVPRLPLGNPLHYWLLPVQESSAIDPGELVSPVDQFCRLETTAEPRPATIFLASPPPRAAERRGRFRFYRVRRF